mgnify:FL=1
MSNREENNVHYEREHPVHPCEFMLEKIKMKFAQRMQILIYSLDNQATSTTKEWKDMINEMDVETKKYVEKYIYFCISKDDVELIKAL